MNEPLTYDRIFHHDNPSGECESLHADSTFYFTDGNVYLQAENCIYKVHRYFFVRESTLFKELFEWLEAYDNTGAGLSDRNPIPLGDTSKLELVCFLKYFYFGTRHDFRFDQEIWTQLLAFSSRFICQDLRKVAIARLTQLKDNISALDQLHMAVEYRLSDWFEPAYEWIVCHDKPAPIEDIKRLPLVIVLLLARSRELFHHRDNWDSKYSCTPRRRALDIIREVSEPLEMEDFIPTTSIVGRWLRSNGEPSPDWPVVLVPLENYC